MCTFHPDLWLGRFIPRFSLGPRFVAFTLFLLTCFASCYVYANVTK